VAGYRPFAAPVMPYNTPYSVPQAPTRPMSRVGLLLPLTGGNAALGQSMLNAGQLALFDQGDRSIELLPRDTRSSPAGAAEAAREAEARGAVAIAGPLTLGETAAVARATRVPVFAFTSDEAQAGNRVWVPGITPTQQARRVMSAANERGAQRFGLLAPNDAFGQRLAAAMREAARQAGWPAPLVELVPQRTVEFGAPAEAMRAAGVEAVLVGFGGAGARAAAQALAAGGSPPLILGTVLWGAEGGLGDEPALAGALFPGPDPSGRDRFDAQFEAAFGGRASRLAGPAYDAVALAARTAREGTPPVGNPFLGADGPIELSPGGVTRRGLAVFALQPGGQPRLVSPAPMPGGAGS
jgi:branched-chain amino acid transport system substrate-binding protein